MSAATWSGSVFCNCVLLLVVQVTAMQDLFQYPEDSDLLVGLHEQGATAVHEDASAPWFPLSERWPKHLSDMSRLYEYNVVLVPVLIGFALLILVLGSLMDWRQWIHKGSSCVDSSCRARTEDVCMNTGETVSRVVHHVPIQEPKLQVWSKAGILCLTSYRFYTGFLSATWMPYLLAMEGHAMLGPNQAFFMGTTKLIYGMSIMMNPMFGLVGDQMAVISHWSGRRVFILLGVAAGGLGIYGCIVAAQIGSVGWYLAAVVLWMLGEAMADVTTETLVPELLPRSQYDVGASIRAVNFLVGGLVGYSALIMFRHWHYTWLYYGYMLVMLACAFLTLSFIHTEDLGAVHSRQRKSLVMDSLVEQAYLLPARLEGGFPKACLCLFVFSLGTAPMFFLLLMVRDLIGIRNHVAMQMQFSIISIIFFISAALASVLDKYITPSTDEESTNTNRPVAGAEAGAGAVHDPQTGSQKRKAVVLRWQLMVYSTVCFGAVAAAMPVVGLLPNITFRTCSFYAIAVLFGAAFGSVYSRFQECTWSLLPPGVDIANAMGFAAMCKLAGVGIGNFLAGIVLDICTSRGHSLSGYFIMCTLCAFVVLYSAKLANEVAATALEAVDAK